MSQRTVLGIATLFVLGSVAGAQPLPPAGIPVAPPELTPSERAHAAAAEGAALAAAGNHLQAAAKYEEAYAYEPTPTYLFESAQSYRLGQECTKAGTHYRKYLEIAPNASNRGEAVQFLQDVDVCVLFGEGRRLMGAGKPAEACEKFSDAYDRDPTAVGTLLNLGLCNQQLGKLATAIDWFRRGRTLAADANLTASQAEATQRIETLQATVPRLEIVLPTPRDVTITIDGKKTSAGTHEVDPGTHVIEAERAARPFSETVTVGVGQQVKVYIPTEDAKSKVPAYILGGAGFALVVGSVVVSSIGKDRYDNAITLDEQNKWKSVVRYGGTGMFVGGLAAIGTGVFLYLRAAKSDEHARATIVTPTAGPGGVGLAVGGSF